jgi:hypothetical protein
MSGSVYPYPIKEKDRILTDLHDEYEACQQDCPGVTMEEFLKKNGDIFNFFWYDLVQNPAPIILHTTTGEPMLFSEAIFEVKDKEAVLSGLSKIKGFEEDEDKFIWLDEGKNEESATILGWIEIQENRLILKCNSKKRLEKGKKLIIKALSEALIHKIDTFQDPMEAVKSYKEVPSEIPENEIPIEVQQELYTEFMQKHFVKWLREKLPALNGRTPLHAVKTEEGRKKVIDLLKMFENNEEHNKRENRPHYDISWLWERLGLEREG